MAMLKEYFDIYTEQRKSMVIILLFYTKTVPSWKYMRETNIMIQKTKWGMLRR
jgi:hypothetical protein